MNSSGNKLGLHIKSEQQDPTSDPLAGVDGSFGQMNAQPGSNRPMMPQTSPERIQALPSNVVNKSNSMDVSHKNVHPFIVNVNYFSSLVHAATKSNICLFNAIGK